MWHANPTWGSPCIVGELKNLGTDVTKSTVEKYRPHNRKPPSPTWRTFLDQHVKEIVSVDFFVVPTITHQVLFVFLVFAHDRRPIVHFNVTSNPTGHWTAQELVEAFPIDTAPRYLLPDRDKIYSASVKRRIRSLGIREVVTAPASPWQNPYVERAIGTLRRELLDHVIVLNERHLRRLLSQHLDYYHPWRLHRSLGMDAPDTRALRRADLRKVVEFPAVAGLHHYYLPLAR